VLFDPIYKICGTKDNSYIMVAGSQIYECLSECEILGHLTLHENKKYEFNLTSGDSCEQVNIIEQNCPGFQKCSDQPYPDFPGWLRYSLL
jgi:hypothetical protein